MSMCVYVRLKGDAECSQQVIDNTEEWNGQRNEPHKRGCRHQKTSSQQQQPNTLRESVSACRKESFCRHCRFGSPAVLLT
jgi:type VI protein secretion system component Hcp